MKSTKVFRSDLDFFMKKIQNRENFTLTRYGDGEMMVMFQTNTFNNQQFQFDSTSNKFEIQRNWLTRAFKHKAPSYYIGLACRCCVGDENHEQLKAFSNQPESQLTWSNIFVNANYTTFLFKITEALQHKSIVLIANKNADLSELPFSVDHFYGVGVNAWVNELSLIDKLKRDIIDKNLKNHVFLICAGPFANIIAYQLFLVEEENTYIDIGSSMDIWMGLPPSRDYQLGTAFLDRTCIW